MAKSSGGLGWGTGLALGAVLGWGIWQMRRPREKYLFRGRTVLIAGGSRGLGLIMARRIAAEGGRLVLLARSVEALKRAEDELRQRGADVLAIPCDIRVREAAEEAVRRAVERFGGIDVLINNAGIIQVGPMEHMTLDDFEDAMGVHFYGPATLTLAVLPHMRRRGGGRIVNVSSIAGRIAVPHLLPYVASKFALTGFSDALRAELRRDRIFVTTVCPGLMRTGSAPNALFKGRHQLEYAWFAVSAALPLISIDADRAACQIIEACRRGQGSLTITVQARAAVLLNALCPETTAKMMALANRLLPGPAPHRSTESYSGWQSQSRWVPSWLTCLNDRATARNNEKPPAASEPIDKAFGD